MLFGLLGSLLLMKFLAKLPAKPQNLLPAGTMGWLPFFGETLAFLKPHNSNSLGTYLQDRCLRYGMVFKSHLFGSPAIVSCDVELNLFILQNEEKLFQAYYPKAMHGILGNYSLLVVSGDLHKKLRSIIVRFINSSKSQPKFLGCVENLVISMIKSWNDLTQVSFFKEAKRMTLSVMVKSVLNIEPNEPIAVQILEDFETYMKGFVSLPILFPGTSYYKAVKARERLSSIVKNIIEERVVGKREVGEEEEEEVFLDMIMKKEENLSEEEKLSIVLDILLGGYETTATLMSLVVYFICHQPHVLQQLKEEHQAIRQDKKDGEPLNWEDYKKMEFTYHVTCEAMRCGNVVKFVHRKALQDVKYKDILIPSGWKVFPIFTGVHFDQSLHDKPHEFNPWRWTDKEMRKKVTPFGGGARLCPGAELAKVVIGFSLHHIVLNYRWKTKADESPLAYPYVEFRRGLILEIEPAANRYIL
ncbi:cytochrome P450 724B1 isoform X2 [Humulus lupulus]|uniref:cytochrome P450 724B1 isoform X2 n=1 Tax=Humulus lupulus TaxID=3486 RepID=UPI002B416B84|nr:cytochrome P450 724B1 isoform X2 [Humulus lupulus]